MFFCGRKSRRSGETQPAPTTPAMGPTIQPPAYIPPNLGYMSPNTQKHMSMTSTSVTDACGITVKNVFIYGYPKNYQKGYSYPAMHDVYLGPPQPQHQPQPSPSTDIFGPMTPPQQPMSEAQDSARHSLRASSPSSMNAVAPVPAVGGIEAFLQRQRMSPPPEAEQYPGRMGPGPYEMSATGTHMRQ